MLGVGKKQEHARSNVKLTRAAHDRWGIGKIVFVFSDDFLKKVYTFPWFHDPEWRQVMIDKQHDNDKSGFTTRNGDWG